VPLTQIPPAALERLVIVANQAARFALTTATVQNGDTVKQTDTNIMYFVTDDTLLSGAGGYEVYTAGTASAVAWSGVTGTPTTLSGYGITDYAAAAKAAAVSDSITDAITDVAPSQNAVFDALALKAPLNSPAFTGTPTGITATHVGLGNVDNVQQLPMSYLDTDTALAANSDAKVPSQKAIKSYVDTAIAGVNPPFISATNDNAGSITIRQAVYFKSNGNVDLAKADAVATSDAKLGLVYAASIATTASGNIYVDSGTRVSGFSGLTPGAPVYLSAATAGALTQTAPSTAGQVMAQVGLALSASVIEFDPEPAIEILS
jgi:hypothetical protein